ncbi:hypothetical protein M231_06084 [Tremella mesenterica]|uniref:Homeobox domain-containing protein n=1 Tax=Tremella mesenterica TaxID=5217 RepID=A0A4Q1BGF4_TREME|nr:hypothetical protein M231_06084 [Tremella mesenterica]
MSSSLYEILQLAGDMQTKITMSVSSKIPTRPIARSGCSPQLEIPNSADDWLYNESSRVSGSSYIPSALSLRIVTYINNLQRHIIDAYESAVAGTVSMEDIGGKSDVELERQICVVFERFYWTALEELRTKVKRVILEDKVLSGSTSNSSFQWSALQLLESAYTRTHMLSVRECQLVAQAADLDPTQVRTWFQNRRAREKRAAVSGKPFRAGRVKKERPVAKLPKRNQQPTSIPSTDATTPNHLTVPIVPIVSSSHPSSGLSISQAAGPQPSTSLPAPIVPSQGGRKVRALPTRGKKSTSSATSAAMPPISLTNTESTDRDKSLSRSVSTSSDSAASHDSYFSPSSFGTTPSSTAFSSPSDFSTSPSSVTTASQQIPGPAQTIMGPNWRGPMITLPDIPGIPGFDFTPPTPSFPTTSNPSQYPVTYPSSENLGVGLPMNEEWATTELEDILSNLTRELNMPQEGSLDFFGDFGTLSSLQDSLSQPSNISNWPTHGPPTTDFPTFPQVEEGNDEQVVSRLVAHWASMPYSLDGEPNESNEEGSEEERLGREVEEWLQFSPSPSPSPRPISSSPHSNLSPRTNTPLLRSNNSETSDSSGTITYNSLRPTWSSSQSIGEGQRSTSGSSSRSNSSVEEADRTLVNDSEMEKGEVDPRFVPLPPSPIVSPVDLGQIEGYPMEKGNGSTEGILPFGSPENMWISSEWTGLI